MVLPIIIGVGVTIAALTAKATINTIVRCRQLTPVEIARLNGKYIPRANIWPQDNIYWRQFHQMDDSMLHGGFQDKMDYEEALHVLGLEGRVRLEDVKRNHRRLMMLNHPDKGGSRYVAMKINTAKDIILKDLENGSKRW